ncbi:Predicted arabinose efflux permease, MFS family [Actinacidiphila alni]|uniref:Predicted arabinose efflux permease, MFS family n=1 Tax=Actinacidiphila alni TaxID=380248 RepID=A0A1I2JBV8_9ACTN|nr:MFS transporter [Actinacidiphila alni]SFF51578.1 Predicted arabinose efflux permease, MFS family [Actinacidiphila alni]
MTGIQKVTGGLPPAFLRLWAASGVSGLGDGVYLAALPLLASSLTHDPFTLSLVAATALVPWLLFGLIGGALVDRWDRQRTMWTVDAGRAVLLAVPVVAAAFDVLSIPLLVGVAFLLGTGQLLFDTAAQAYIPELLSREPAGLRVANSRLQATTSAGEGFVGPPTGSVLFTIGRAVPFALDALSFALSAILIRTLPAGPKRAEASDKAKDGARGGIWAEARAGASYVFHHRVLLGLALRPAIGNIAFMAGEGVLVLFAHERLHISSSGYGLLLACEAVGGLAGSTFAGRIGERLGTGGALTATAAVEGLALLGFAVSPGAVPAGCCLAVLGAAMGATMVLGATVRQSIVPAELMGRVTAVTRLLAVSAAPLGALLGGFLASSYGLRAPFLVGSALLMAMTFVTASLTTNHRVEDALAAARPRPTTAEVTEDVEVTKAVAVTEAAAS